MSIFKSSGKLLIGAGAAVVMLAGGASAQYGPPCVANGSTVVYCDWGGAGCWQLNTGDDEKTTDADCAKQASNCAGNLYTGKEGAGTCESLGNTPFENSTSVVWSVQGGLVNCSWGPVVELPDGTLDKGCHQKEEQWCKDNYGDIVDDATCELHNAGGGGDDYEYCDWGPVTADGGGCHKLPVGDTDKRDEYIAVGRGVYSTADCSGSPIAGGVGIVCDFGKTTSTGGGCFWIAGDTATAYCESEGGTVVASDADCEDNVSVRHVGAKARTVSNLFTIANRTISVSGATDSKVNVRLINMKGKTVAKYNLKSGASVTLRKVPAGSYIVEAKRVKDGVKGSAKITLK